MVGFWLTVAFLLLIALGAVVLDAYDAKVRADNDLLRSANCADSSTTGADLACLTALALCLAVLFYAGV